MTRPVPACAVDFIMRAEACVLTARLDTAGRVFVGWGHTPAAGTLRVGDTITVVEAKAFLQSDLAVAAARLALRVTEAAILKLAEHEYAALISFVFNLGIGEAAPIWTIWSLLNAGQIDQVPTQIMRFDKDRDPATHKLVEVPGLINRRMAEVSLWKTADVSASIAIIAAAPVAAPPSSQTREDDTPPTPAAVKPIAESKTFISTAITAAAATASACVPMVGTVASGLKQTSDAIAPYTDANPMIGKVQQGLMIGLAVLAVVSLVLVWIKHQQARAA